MNNGYVIVASRLYVYYNMAVLCAESLRDFHPDAHVTLFTHEEWVDDRAEVFDKVVTGIPNSKRSKLWALSKVEYDNVMYLDADCEIMHEDISTVFDTLQEDDIKVMKVRPYCAAASKFPGGELTLHMGVFAYKNNERVRDLFDQWYIQYEKQTHEPWDLDPELYPEGLLKPWDIFTFWRLMELDGWKDKVKVGIWEDDARCNMHGLLERELKGKPPIIWHHSISAYKHDHEKNIPEE